MRGKESLNFKWRQASSLAVNKISRGQRKIKVFRQRIRLYSFSTIILYLLSATYDTSVRAPNYQILFELGEKTRNSKGISVSLPFFVCTCIVHTVLSTSTAKRFLRRLEKLPIFKIGVSLKLSLRRQDETILEIAFFSSKKNMENPRTWWKLEGCGLTYRPCCFALGR